MPAHIILVVALVGGTLVLGAAITTAGYQAYKRRVNVKKKGKPAVHKDGDIEMQPQPPKTPRKTQTSATATKADKVNNLDLEKGPALGPEGSYMMSGGLPNAQRVPRQQTPGPATLSPPSSPYRTHAVEGNAQPEYEVWTQAGQSGFRDRAMLAGNSNPKRRPQETIEEVDFEDVDLNDNAATNEPATPAHMRNARKKMAYEEAEEKLAGTWKGGSTGGEGVRGIFTIV